MKQRRRKIYLTVMDSEILVHIPVRKVIEMIQPRVNKNGEFDLKTFTNRERQVFNGVCRGLGNKEIGGELHIAERTVKFHVSRLLSKIPDVQGRKDIIRKFGT